MSTFLLNILLVIMISSVLIGIVSSVMYVGRLAPIAGSIAHSILGGVGLAVWLGCSLWLGAIGVAIISCIILAFTNVYAIKHMEVVSNILWGGGMALGLIFISFAKGYQQNLSNFLFGNIVLVSSTDAWIILGLTIFIFFILLLLYRQLLVIWFSPVFARIQKLNQFFLWFISMLIVGLGVISLVKTAGIALALILLSVPQHIARMLVKSNAKIIIITILLSFISMITGIIISYYFNTPAGATSVIVCLLFYSMPLIQKLWFCIYKRY